ncbi:MAG: hypothetical protein DWQ45_13065 [Planctomycetota bacterium]|nr:MAG: hypothetical protein DWQ41_12495 [Planctomycetota bacterium]REK34684.1 MAG: hypothetical protein DWQ45_13065 [Planctomycetota bacterium]
MLSKRISSIILPSLVLFAVGCGDGAEQTAETASADADWVALSESPVPTADAVPRTELKLNLRAGDRFPLRKVVEQELAQSEAGQLSSVSRSRLEMLMAITVDERQGSETRLSVRYDRIRFEQEVGGRKVVYDSANPPQSLPGELAAYHGMIGNGFSFWLDAKNRIQRVEGFSDFLDSCLRHVPAEQRSRVLLGVEVSSGEDGVADFIDDTIGLLPFDAPKAVGESWTRTRRMARPVQMEIQNVCTLDEFTDQFAVIDIRGRVTPILSSGVQTVSHESVTLRVNNGFTQGRCVVFRDTGLPRESRIEHEVEMTVVMPGGASYDQHKRVVSTVQAYPAMRAAGVAPASPARR